MMNQKVVTGLSVLLITLPAAVTITTYVSAIKDHEAVRKPCEKWSSEELLPNETNKDGSITSDGTIYQKHEIYNDGNSLRGCECLKQLCVRKCCSMEHIYESYEENEKNHLKCVNDGELTFSIFLLEVELYEYTPRSLPIISENWTSMLMVNEELLPYCQGGQMRVHKNNYLLINGSLLIQDDPNKGYELKTINDYCGELINDTVHFFTCFDTEKSNNALKLENTLKLILFLSMLITLPLLIITFLVYYFFPDLHHLVGKSLCCLTFTKIISYNLWILLYHKVVHVGALLCAPIGCIFSYNVLASFFWLNVLCFDIWLAFRENRLQSSIKKDEEMSRLRKRFIYAWGMPAVICLIMFTADKFLPDYSEFKPMIGSDNCVMNFKNKSKLIFYGLPMTILLILNVAMFLTTVLKISSYKKQTAVLKRKGKSYSNQNYIKRLILYFKLFIIMGVAMVADPLALLFEKTSAWSWFLPDLLTPLADALLFAIFLCKRRTLEKIVANMCPSKKYFRKSKSTNADSTKTEPTIESIT